ncbi:C-type lectin 37Db isoform X1 [Drosophila erecta]|nr:C-type lectin 37Db isoform X1 [Drosophila erecta]
MSRILLIILISSSCQNCLTRGAQEAPILKTVEEQQNNDEKFDQVQFERRINDINGLYDALKAKIDKLVDYHNELLKNIADTENQIAKLQRHASVKKASNPHMNFQKIGAKYYHIENKERLNWYEAVSRCRSLNSNLISLQNQKEWEIITANLVHFKAYWVDINDEAAEGDYVSRFTGEKAPFLKWANGEPTIQAGENCVEMEESFGFFYFVPHSMNDVQCSKKNYFICEANEVQM